MENLYRLKGEELAATKGLITRMSEKKEFVESQVKKLRAQMEDREAACARTEMDLQVTVDKLNVHKMYMNNFLEPTAILLSLCKMPSKEDAAKLDAMIREVECHQKNPSSTQAKSCFWRGQISIDLQGV